MALEDIWFPESDYAVRDDQILVKGLPPCLEILHLDVLDITLGDMLSAVITCIQLSYRKDPSDQVLKKVKILVYMYSDRETMEHSPNSIHNSALKLIQEKCEDFLKHGNVVVWPFWCDDEDEDE
ncbi:hypothetical protein DER46DRAFT_570886 [Fusarium sp. MPI-SDFR-AT-0072]|nr:hypothetical protein DER46DRAFT_570886 [Fusarium sp. MPI-SDFR-AT-0072]